MSHFMYLHFQINFYEVEKGGCAAVSQATLMPSVLIFLTWKLLSKIESLFVPYSNPNNSIYT